MGRRRELLEFDADFDPAEPVSADTTGGMEAITAPTSTAAAEAPIQVYTRELLSAPVLNSTRLNFARQCLQTSRRQAAINPLPLFSGRQMNQMPAGEDPSTT
jgi:hypothetical protein